MDSSKVQSFRVSSNAITTYEAWSAWKRGLQYYLDAKGITCSLRRKAVLLHRGGEELQKIYATLETANAVEVGKSKDQYATALNLLDLHFRPTVNRIFERWNFRQIRQGSDPLETFVVKLRHQAEYCGFHDAEEAIVDQIVEGTSSVEFRKKILESRLCQLDQIISLGKLLESVNLQSSRMTLPQVSTSMPSQSTETESIAKLSSLPSETRTSIRSREKQCSNCGSRRHSRESADCPARGKTCFTCSRMGHFASVCRSGRPSTSREQSDNRNRRQSSPDAPHGRTFPTRTRHDVRAIKEADDDSDGDSAFTFRLIDDSSETGNDDNHIAVSVGGIPLRVMVDSGASCNIIDWNSWDELHRNGVDFEPATVRKKVFPYGERNELPVERAIIAKTQARSKAVWAKFYVLGRATAANGHFEPILGSRTAKILCILRVGYDDDEKVCATTSGKEPVARIGKLKNFSLHLPLDPKVPPVAQACRRVPFALRQQLRAKIEELLTQDIIERVTGATPWVSPIVLQFKKKSGDIRLCIDMRRANEAVMREKFPIPTFDELVVDLRDCSIFSKIDLTAAYHQIELDEESRAITTFVTPDGIFRFKRLYFGIRCAPEIFQGIMQNLLRDIENAKVFFDDIIIFSRTKEDHAVHVSRVMKKLVDHGLTINEKKSIFGVPEIEFLGHKLSRNTIEPNTGNLEAVRKFLPPSGKKELQSFLGLTNFVAKFIPHYSTVTAPLRLLLKKNARFVWGREQEIAFESLKGALCKMKTAIFNPKATLMLLTDASPVGLGAVLMQREAPHAQPEIVAFASHSLSVVEQKYSQIEREALGIVWGCEKFRMYTLGRKFELYTDNQPLQTLFGPKSVPNARIERWLMRLQRFDYTICHIAGEKNIADPFSRLCPPAVQACTLFSEVNHSIRSIVEWAIPKAFSIAEINDESALDPEIAGIRENLRTGASLPPEYARFRTELSEWNNILLRGERIIPPPKLRKGILAQAHEGHPGIEIMKRRLRTKIWWPNIDKDATEFVKRCHSCLVVSRENPPTPMKRTALPTTPWEYVAIDYMGPLPDGRHILVVVDYFSRFIELAFTQDTTSATTIRALQIIFCRNGFPLRLKSDNAQAFRSQDFESFLTEYGIEHITSPPLWPQANGEVERQNRSLLKRLKIASVEGKDLEVELAKYLLLYHSTPHSTTGAAPAQLLFRRSLRDKLPSIIQPSLEYDMIIDHDSEQKEAGKRDGDHRRHARPSQVQLGSQVLLPAPHENKLSPCFDPAPYTVVSQSPDSVVVERDGHRLRRSLSAVKPLTPDSPIPVRVAPETPLSHPASPLPIETSSPIPQIRSYAAVCRSPSNVNKPQTLEGATSTTATRHQTPSLEPIKEPIRSRSGREIRAPLKLNL